jgi:enamine deaminase RidA (YjgF/YER057c/UK114 family)
MSRGPIIPVGADRTYSRFQFAPAFRVGDTVYISGVIGRGSDGSVPEAAADEFDAAFRHLGDVLAAAGATFTDIVDLTTFHVGLATLGEFMAVKARYIAEPFPAWTAVGVSGLTTPGARAEVKAVAVITPPDQAG